MTHKIGLIGLFAVNLVGCHEETVESEDIRTSGIWASFEVLATGNARATVKSQLRVGGDHGTVIVLTGSDALVCNSGEVSQTLAKQGKDYETTFDGEAGGTLFTCALNRGSADDSAPNSTVSLPDPFAIVGVAADQAISRAASLSVTWEAAVIAPADKTMWRLSGDCLFDTHGSVVADGGLTLQGEDFDPDVTAEQAAKAGDTERASCTATLCIERIRNGALDDAFAREEGGMITATQRRCVDFISTP